MSGVITAVVGTAAVATYMNYEQQRQAQSKADEKVKQEQIKMDIEKAWSNKKKGINDQNASQAALRLRGAGEVTNLSGTRGGSLADMVGNAGSQMNQLGLLGPTPNTVGVPSPSQKAQKILNSPLGL